MKRGVKEIPLTEKTKRKIREIEKQRIQNVITQKEAASLIGVCVPTYRKWARRIAKEDSEK